MTVHGDTSLTRDVYLSSVLDQMPRLLGLMDRNVGSSTYGCFDRQYWHYATTDFACAEYQESVPTLAHLYLIDHARNPYHACPQILEWINAGLDFWTRIQHPNGSFAEWYPNENSMSVTPFSAYAISETLLVMGDLINCRERVTASLEKAADWLMSAKDLRVANHYAATPVALYNMFLLTGRRSYVEAARSILKDLSRLQDDEGWFVEYGGADVGYTSVTLYYLANLYVKNRDESLLPMMEKAVRFCHYFIHPDGTFGGEYGSRNTEYIIPHGFELLAADVPEAALIASRIRASLGKRLHVGPHCFDDRYWAYLSYPYIQAYVDARDHLEPSIEAPYQRAFTKIFPSAGISIRSTEDYYCVFNVKKGGAFKLDFKKTKRSVSDNGLVLEDRKGKVYYSSYLDPNATVTDLDGALTASRMLARIPEKRLTPLGMIVQRAFMITLGRVAKVEAWLKDLLRDLLITNIKLSEFNYSRTLELHAEGCVIRDAVNNADQIRKLCSGEKGSYVYGPSTRFFQASSAATHPVTVNAPDIGARDPKTLTVTRRISSDGVLQASDVSYDLPN